MSRFMDHYGDDEREPGQWSKRELTGQGYSKRERRVEKAIRRREVSQSAARLSSGQPSRLEQRGSSTTRFRVFKTPLASLSR